MRLIILTITLFLSYSFTQKTIINDPKLSLRCQGLLTDRQEKIALGQKTRALIERSELLLKHHEQSKREAAKQKAKITRRQLTQNLALYNLSIKNINENIIRSGCPGVPL